MPPNGMGCGWFLYSNLIFIDAILCEYSDWSSHSEHSLARGTRSVKQRLYSISVVWQEEEEPLFVSVNYSPNSKFYFRCDEWMAQKNKNLRKNAEARIHE